MSYWGSKPEECDFASGSIGANIFLIKKRLLKDIDSDPKFEHEEQSILSNLMCLRLIGQKFPKALRVHFRKKDYLHSKESFYTWYENGGRNVPEKYREKLLQAAESEFLLFEEQILTVNEFISDLHEGS